MLGKLIRNILRGADPAPEISGRSAGQDSRQIEAEALFLEGLGLADAGKLDRACECYRRAADLYPGHGRARNNLGLIQQKRGDISAAKISFHEAARADPSLAQPHINLANLLQDQGELEAAVAEYGRALQRNPDIPEAHYGRGTALLALGRFEGGWQGYEWRWRLPKQALDARRYRGPRWDGASNLSGKRLLVYSEQGFGDSIQFARYMPLLAALGATVIIECRPELAALLRSAPGVAAVVLLGEEPPAFDCHIPIMSLPLVFATTLASIPAEIPYLFPDGGKRDYWRGKVVGPGEKAVGLAWAGNPEHFQDKERSCPARNLLPLLELNNDYYSLQKGASRADLDILRARGAEGGPTDFTPELRDFEDTAAFMLALDLVISVDTAVAHLAGALGKEVFLMLPYSVDWRWLSEGERSPWYPTMRIFRQSSPGDWQSVVSRVHTALQNGR